MRIFLDGFGAKCNGGMAGASAPIWRVTLPSIVFLLTACSASIKPLELAKTNQRDQLDAVNKVWSEQKQVCVAMLDKLDQQSISSNKARLAIAVVGTLSGSVFSQLAKGSGKDAWSGLSGSTNALQSALDKSFSASLMLSEALAVAIAVAEVNDKFIEEDDVEKKLQIAYTLPIACRVARLTAIDKANRALSGSTSSLQSDIKTLLNVK